jgi:hypothetical protein
MSPNHHPNVHQASKQWSEDQVLHVASCYSNPFRWRTRRELANDFRHHMEQSPNVVFHMGELAYGDRPFEVTDANNPLDLQLRTSHELFHKENILNAVIRRFPPDWKYGAWIDADFLMTRHDWALEAIHQLQHYDFVQLFSSYSDLSGKNYGAGMRPVRVNAGFAYNYIQSGFSLPSGYGQGGWKTSATFDEYGASQALPGKPVARPVGATGGAWAFRRSALDAVGGLLDICILGHGDWFMAFGLVCQDAPDVGFPKYHDAYRQAVIAWQKNAARLKNNIGYIDNFAIHHFHGSKMRRFYTSRYQILIEENFNPMTDLRPDWQGIYQLNTDKFRLRDRVRQYFIDRTEDDPALDAGSGERPLI